MDFCFAPATPKAKPLYLLRPDQVTAGQIDSTIANLTEAQNAWLKAADFTGAFGQAVILPDQTGAIGAAVVGLGDARAAARNRFALAAARPKLGNVTYNLITDLSGPALEAEALGWLFAGYVFDRYAKQSQPQAQMVAPTGIDAARLEIIAEAEGFTRDLINTPANDMGPDALEAAALTLALRFDATASVITGDALLSEGFPLVHTVGRAADRAPRLIDMTWGTSGPLLTLVGKGVCFDTGGLNLKPGASMGLMKKDMGGAATVLGLAQMIMALKLPLRLRVLIPAVENAVAGNAFRPGDILPSRKGLTVEINNTDAEGRLVLADALALADEAPSDLIITMATLTGAARTAVGPDLAPFYATKPGDAAAVMAAALIAQDPCWQMPFHEPYEKLIEPGIADLDNAPSGGMAGSITAALFLRRFVTTCPRYMHFDIYGWNPSSAPGRPKGGVGMGARALLAALPELLGIKA